MFAFYVHHLDPVIFKIGVFKLHWYGLAYLLGFAAGFLLLRYLAQRKLWVLAPDQAGDFIAAAALLGVFIGGRLGYVLFYELLDSPEARAKLLAHPWSIFKVTEGGMASHGGILGLVIFTWFYARRKKVAWTALGDGLCVVAPVGLFFGRLANFVNGELYGRVAHGVSWAMKFPRTLQLNHPEVDRFYGAADAMEKVVPDLLVNAQGGPRTEGEVFDAMLEATRTNPAARAAIEPYLEPRHPSQFYEAALEGIALFAILWFVRWKFPKAPNGLLTAMFFFFYALFRIFGEQFREPDATTFNILGLLVTKGQFLSFFMFAFATAFFIHAFHEWKKARTTRVAV